MASKFALIIANSSYGHSKTHNLFKTGADAGGMRHDLLLSLASTIIVAI